jgi:hypothetical protein
MRVCLVLIAAASLVRAWAGSNIDPEHAESSSQFIGVIDWRPNETSGAVINQYYCSGFIYGEAVGWINLGSGTPANRVAYSNTSANDFGVNVSPAGQLSGFAYGANIGWINFTGANARVDWSSGKLSGSVWAANAGWISLAADSQFVRVESLPELPDTDDDGLPDAWEIQVAGSLGVLSGDADTDHDGQTDLEEYLAGTNPFDPKDFVGPLTLQLTQDWNEITFPTKKDHIYRIEQHPAFGSGAWTAAAAVPGSGALVTVRLEPNPAQLFFYRLVAYPPLTALN